MQFEFNKKKTRLIIRYCPLFIREYLIDMEIPIRGNKLIRIQAPPENLIGDLVKIEDRMIDDVKKKFVRQFLDSVLGKPVLRYFDDDDAIMCSIVIESLKIGLRLLSGNKRHLLLTWDQKRFLTIILSLRSVRRLSKDVELMILDRIFPISRGLILRKLGGFLDRSAHGLDYFNRRMHFYQNDAGEALWGTKLVEDILKKEPH
jgi:hypothetical protein